MESKQITSASGRSLRVTVARQGINFGWVGVVKAANNRPIHCTDAFPFPAAAFSAAEDWALEQ